MKNSSSRIIMCPLGYGADREGIGFGYVQLCKIYPALGRQIHYLPPAQEAEDFDNHKLKYLQSVTATCRGIARQFDQEISLGKTPLLIGGDHSLALGSVKGALAHYQNLGVLWIDAHGDMNTEKTTQTGNIHGMPLAALQGFGHQALTGLYHNRCIATRNIVLFGIRDLDKKEAAFMKAVGVRWYDYSQILNRGFSLCLEEAVAYLQQNVSDLHISLDLDVLDPLEISGVSVPVSGGFQPEEVWSILERCMHTFHLTSMDVVEYNPLFDHGNITLDYVIRIIRRFEAHVTQGE